MYDTEKSSADRVEAEAREKTPMPKLKIRIAPLGTKCKLNEPMDKEIDEAGAQSPSLILSQKKKPKMQLAEKPTKKSRKEAKATKSLIHPKHVQPSRSPIPPPKANKVPVLSCHCLFSGIP